MNREQRETRESEQRPRQWRPPSALPDPNPRPGWKHRYVRTSTLGKEDTKNVSTRYQDGFEPCKWEDYPEIEKTLFSNQKKTGNIEVGGLILCRAPVEMVDQRNAGLRGGGERFFAKVGRGMFRIVGGAGHLAGQRNAPSSGGGGGSAWGCAACADGGTDRRGGAFGCSLGGGDEAWLRKAKCGWWEPDRGIRGC